MELLRAIRASVEVPLVIHGGSGLSREAVAELIAAGVTMFQVGTVMKQRFLQAARETLAGLSATADTQATVGSRKLAGLPDAGQGSYRRGGVGADPKQYGSAGRAF